jgi:ATPase subunit of ABC transporter with duplicated ATPase domains
LLDELINRIDIQSITSVADAFNPFFHRGIIIFYGFRFLVKIAKEILECKNDKFVGGMIVLDNIGIFL